MQTNNTELNAALAFAADQSLSDHPAWARIEWGVNVLRDMSVKLTKYGRLSPKQADFARDLHKRSLQSMQWAEERAAKKAKLIAEGIRAPEGRTEVSGTVISTKVVSTNFGSVLKCLVELPTGAKVWGTVPMSADSQKGSKVCFVATFEPSNDDPTFGFYKRPSNWREAA